VEACIFWLIIYAFLCNCVLPKGVSQNADFRNRALTDASLTSVERVRTDERGAVLTVGVFIAVFLVALLYHIISLGHGLLYKNRMQDAVDAGAYTAATTYARGMNTVSLINHVQFISTTVLLALNWIEVVLDNCDDAGNTYGVYPFSLCPGLLSKYRNVKHASEAELFPFLELATDTAEAVRDAVPSHAAADVTALQTEAYGQPIILMALVPQSLPLRTTDLLPACAKGRIYLKQLGENALPELKDAADNGYTNLLAYIPDPEIMRVASEKPLCPALTDVGVQVMDPPNQSGTEALQVRVFVLGNLLEGMRFTPGTEFLRSAFQPGAAKVYDPDEGLLAAGRAALAQAEYYSAWRWANTLQTDGTFHIPEENAFHMHWRARLRRVRIPVDTDPNRPQLAAQSFQNWVQNHMQPTCRARCATLGCSAMCLSFVPFGRLGMSILH